MAKVLIIDDSRVVIQKLKNVLEPGGHEVVATDLLIQIPDVIKDDAPDVVVLDLNMPALGGVAVASLIKRFQKNPIPIVIYSSGSKEDLEAAAAEIGAADIVQKGDADSRLTAAISRALQQH